MEGFSSPPRRGLLPFKAEDSTNLVELDQTAFHTHELICEKSFGFRI